MECCWVWLQLLVVEVGGFENGEGKVLEGMVTS